MILNYILIIFFFSLASICNSIMDTLDHHQESSIFSKFKNKMWWNFHQGWRNKYIDRDPKNGRVKWNILGILINKPVQLTDAWHFFKMLMIIFAAISITLALTNANIIYLIDFKNDLNYILNCIIHMSILAFAWNPIFTLFYHKIWMIKN